MATSDAPDFTGSTTLTGGTIDATITNSSLTVNPAAGSTFDITGPVSIPGNPQITTGWRGGISNFLTQLNQSVDTDLYGSANGPIDISGFGSVLVVLEITAGTGCEVMVDFLIPNGSGGFIGVGLTHTIVMESHADHFVIIPAQTNDVHIHAVNRNAGMVDLEWTVVPLNESVNNVTYPVSNNFLSESAVTVPINSTSNFYLPFVQPGPATLSFHARGGVTDFSVSVLAVDDQGVAGTFILTGQAALKDGVFQLSLPARTVMVAVTNTSTTAARSFDMGLQPAGIT